MKHATDNEAEADPSAPRTLRDWLPLVYEKACERAHRLLAKWSGVNRPGTASLVHQAFFKLSECGIEQCESRAHALALLVQKMRQQLCDLARRIDAQKRGGRGHEGAARPVFHRQLLSDELAAQQGWEPADFLALDEALVRLHEIAPRHARVVELLFLLGLTFQEAAEELELSRASVHNDWRLAKAWLYHELTGAASEDDAAAVKP
jgi:RNA polymerase sigma factor (TIGR02999 family)